MAGFLPARLRVPVALILTVSLGVALCVALWPARVIALPYVLFQIWAFVAPGLYTHEKSA